VQPDRPIRIGRRSLLIGAGTAAALLATTGCTPFSSAPTTRTVTSEAPPPIDPMENLIATTQLHLLRLNAAVAKGGQLAATLTPLREDRAAHLEALREELARTDPKSPAAKGTTPTGTVAIPEDDDAIITMVRDDAGNAQVQFTDALGTVSRYRAELLASIAASLATHRTVLA